MLKKRKNRHIAKHIGWQTTFIVRQRSLGYVNLLPNICKWSKWIILQ